MVEFHADPAGIPLHGEDGLWLPFPVEYKRGRPKAHQADELQLCAQAMCLEEMLCCEIPDGALFYGEPRRRSIVSFSPQLRQSVQSFSDEMHQYYRRGYTPKAKPSKSCNACSLKDLCLPQLTRRGTGGRLSPAGHGGNAMKHLLNTLFVTSEDIYLSLDGENVVANRDKQEVARYPLHTLSGIVSFSYSGASPALMGACAQRDVSLAFCTPRGRFLARVAGESSGNVLLRRTQYRMADDPGPSCRIARSMVFGKVYNARWSIERTRRDHGLRVDGDTLAAASNPT